MSHLVQAFHQDLKEVHLDADRPLLMIQLKDGSILYIRYNDFVEYSYQIMFSHKPLDRVRFDNYDDRWEVSTRPHHLHPRNQEKAKESQMTGIPSHDIPLLIDYVRRSKQSKS